MRPSDVYYLENEFYTRTTYWWHWSSNPPTSGATIFDARRNNEVTPEYVSHTLQLFDMQPHINFNDDDDDEDDERVANACYK